MPATDDDIGLAGFRQQAGFHGRAHRILTQRG